MKERFTMLHTQTTDQLLTLRLEGMVAALEEQRRSASYQALSFEDRLAILVERDRGPRQPTTHSTTQVVQATQQRGDRGR